MNVRFSVLYSCRSAKAAVCVHQAAPGGTQQMSQQAARQTANGPHRERVVRDMKGGDAIIRTNMAAMAHVFLAHRVRSIHIEKDTILLENICGRQTCFTS
ncbi:hypothetical protein EYF80_028198 [Liparis tanakae]|uniref:Uncharacterized protein n=1 Tax=Liparis tanakae TaxID=230148 RepID=A0A4Z2H752_9TELE|nr:hypothetical protein EYF80_028198 [Liparis tanakae]